MKLLKEISLIICTKDRPERVKQLLDNLLELSSLPNLICIVDSSSTNKTESIVVQVQKLNPTIDFVYLHTHPGAPHQKNIGLQYLENLAYSNSLEVVSFLDDDVCPNDTYFENILQLFRKHSQIMALGGYDENAMDPKIGLTWGVLLLGGFKKGGRILKSGICTTAKPENQLDIVDWIPGGMQNFRWSKFRGKRFNGEIRIYGDEVELQTRVFEQGTIATSRLLGVVHYSETAQKDNYRDETSFYDGFRWFLATSDRAGVKKWAVIFTTLILIVGQIPGTLGLVRRNRLALLGHLDFLVRVVIRRPTQQFARQNTSLKC